MKREEALSHASSSLRRAVPGLILIALGVAAYAWLWPQAPVLVSDSWGYLEVSRDLADGRLERLHFRSIGYPLLLLATGSAEAPTRLLFVVSLTFHFAAVWIAIACLARLGIGRRRRIAFAALASLPPFVQPAAQVLTENPSQLLLLAAFALLLAPGRRAAPFPAAAAGLLLGLATLVRPTFQALGVGLALFLLVLPPLLEGRRPRRRELAAAAALALASVVVMVAVATWNLHRFGHFGISPGNLGYSLSTKTVRVLERLPERYAAEREVLIEARDRHLVERGSSHTAEQYLPQAKPGLRRVTGLEGGALEERILELNLVLIRAAPLNFLLEVLRSFPGFWFPVAEPLSTGGSRALMLLWALLHFSLVGLFLLQATVVAGALLLVLGRRLRSALEGRRGTIDLPRDLLAGYLLAAAVVVYTMLVSCVVHHGEARFRSPAELLVLLMAFVGFHWWWRLAAPAPASSPEVPK